MPGQLGQASEAPDEVVAETDRVGGGEAQALESPDVVHGLEQLDERAAVAGHRKLVASVEIDDLSEQRDLAAAARDEIAHLVDDASDCAAPLRATGVGHDAERAPHVAALHDRDERAGRRRGMVADGFLRAGLLAGVRNGKPRVVHRGGVRHLPVQERVHVVGDAVELLRSRHQVEMGQFGEKRGTAALRHATEKPEDGVRAALLQAAQGAHFADGLLLGHVADAARVQEDDIRVFGVAGHLVAARDEHLRDLLRVALVHLASVGLEKYLGHRKRR